jgi:hypothetical protein
MRLVSETDLRWVRGVWARASLRGLCWVREGVVKRGSWLGLVKAKGYQPDLAVQRLLVLFWAGTCLMVIIGFAYVHSFHPGELVIGWEKEAVIGFVR